MNKVSHGKDGYAWVRLFLWISSVPILVSKCVQDWFQERVHHGLSAVKHPVVMDKILASGAYSIPRYIHCFKSQGYCYLVPNIRDNYLRLTSQAPTSSRCLRPRSSYVICASYIRALLEVVHAIAQVHAVVKGRHDHRSQVLLGTVKISVTQYPVLHGPQSRRHDGVVARWTS